VVVSAPDGDFCERIVDQEKLGPTSAIGVTQIHRSMPSRAADLGDSGDRRNAPDLLARLMSLYIVIAVGRIGDLVPPLHAIPLAKLVAVLAIITVMRKRAAWAAVTWKSVPPAKLTIAVMGITTLSILWSVLRSATFGVIIGTVLAVIVTMFLVIKAARGWAPVRTILHGAVLASIVLVATVFTSRLIDSGGFRAGFSSTYDPNDFAFVLIGLLPIVITFGIVSRGAKKLVYLGIAGSVTVAILLTQSRGGFLGLILDVVAMTFLLPVARRGQLQFRVSMSGVIARVVLLALIGVVVWHSLPDTARARLWSVTELRSDYNANISEGALSDPNAGRLAIWTRNFPLILQRPWGFGAGSFEAVDGLFAGGRYRAPHNSLLQALIELGIPGFILFISTIVSSLRYIRVPQNRDPDKAIIAAQDEPRAFARGLTIGWLGLCLSGFFLSELYSNMLWTFVTLSCAVGIVRRLPTTTAVAAISADAAASLNADKKRGLSARAIAKPTR
jgi:O-antigen ligase